MIRGLTDGECALAAEAFGDVLALESIRFLPAPWPFDRAFVPGRWFEREWIVWPARTLPSDISTAALKLQALLVHELTHVWQAQQGVNLLTGKIRAGDRPSSYEYPVGMDCDWAGLNIEQLFGWQRNHYDRFVHLGYGVLVVLPIREIITRECQLKGAWASLIAWSFVLSTSMLYELMEWIGAQYVGGAHSVFVGAQGDIWDAQKDMAAAAGGALLVLVCRGHSLWARLGVRP